MSAIAATTDASAALTAQAAGKQPTSKDTQDSFLKLLVT